ncbi:hypothetical protein SBADM41S_05354 [Streptomyces badius]
MRGRVCRRRRGRSAWRGSRRRRTPYPRPRRGRPRGLCRHRGRRRRSPYARPCRPLVRASASLPASAGASATGSAEAASAGAFAAGSDTVGEAAFGPGSRSSGSSADSLSTRAGGESGSGAPLSPEPSPSPCDRSGSVCGVFSGPSFTIPLPVGSVSCLCSGMSGRGSGPCPGRWSGRPLMSGPPSPHAAPRCPANRTPSPSPARPPASRRPGPPSCPRSSAAPAPRAGVAGAPSWP